MGGKLSGFVHSLAPWSSSWGYQNLLDGLEIQKVEKAQVIGNNMGISKSTDWFSHWGRLLLTIGGQKGSQCFVKVVRLQTEGLLVDHWQVGGRWTVDRWLSQLPRLLFQLPACPAGAVPLKPGAGFKTVSASILRARLGSFCYILLLSFVGVFPVPELIGFQFVSSGKKQVENYILTGPLFKSESIICSCYSDSAHIIQNALFFAARTTHISTFSTLYPNNFFS